MLEANGQKYSSSERRRYGSGFEEGSPVLRIARSGSAIGVVDLEHIIERDFGPAAIRNPTFKTVAEHHLLKPWRIWVEAWKGIDGLKKGAPVKRVASLIMSDVEVSATQTLILIGVHEEHGTVSIQTSATFDPDATRNLGSSLLRSMGSEAEAQKVADLGIDVVHWMRLTTDPATLRPVSAWFEQSIEVESKGKTHRQHERTRYEFEWVDVGKPAESPDDK